MISDAVEAAARRIAQTARAHNDLDMLVPKRHIEALRAALDAGDYPPPAARRWFEERVVELLEATNTEVERRRAAETEVERLRAIISAIRRSTDMEHQTS